MILRFPQRFRTRTLLASVSLSVFAAVTGCSEDRGTPSPHPVAWTSTESAPQHRALRAAQAKQLQANALTAGVGDDQSQSQAEAVTASTIAWVPLSAGSSANAPWFVVLAECIHASELGIADTDVESRIRGLMSDPAVIADPDGRDLCANALGCHLFRQLQRLEPAIDDKAALVKIDDSVALFSQGCRLPEAALNRAAAFIERARRAPDERDSALRSAREALGALDDDALICPSEVGAFLGLRFVGSRVALLIDAAQSMPPAALASSKRAIAETVRALGPETKVGTWVFGAGEIRSSAVGADAFPVGRNGDTLPLVKILDQPEPVESGGILESVELVAASQPTDIIVLTSIERFDLDPLAAELGSRLASKGIRLSALVIAPGYPNDPAIQERCAEGSLGQLIRFTGGNLRVLLGADRDPFSGQSVRQLAEREGRWTPAVERQYRAVSALLALVSDPEKVPDVAKREIELALAPLDPDPVAATIGKAMQDWRCLILSGAIASARADAVAPERFRLAAEACAQAAADADAANDVEFAQFLREQGMRAEFLRALCDPANASECLKHASELRLEVGSWSPETWSGQLLSVSRGWPHSFRAGRSMSAVPPVRSVQEFELSLARATFLGKGLPSMNSMPPTLPTADAVIFRRSVGAAQQESSP